MREEKQLLKINEGERQEGEDLLRVFPPPTQIDKKREKVMLGPDYEGILTVWGGGCKERGKLKGGGADDEGTD